MNSVKIISLIFIVLGALVNFVVPAVLKRKADSEESVMKTIYAVKSLGLIMVIIGCVIIFWLGGKFGV